MATAVLHIGTMKTGTTYLQRLLKTNAELLTEQGRTVPGFLPPNHQAFVLPFTKHVITQHQVRGMVDVGSQASFAASLRQAVEKQMRDSPIPASEQKWIISSEQYTMRLRSRKEIAKAVEFLKPMFESISVIVFFRRPEFILPSVLSQRIKDGYDASWDWDFCEGRLARLDPMEILDKWSAAVGAANVSALPYLEGYKSDSDLFLAATSRATGIHFDSRWIQPAPLASNRSLSAEAMGFLRLTNRYVPRHALDDSRASSVNRSLKKRIMRIADPAPFVPDQATLDLVTEYCKESNTEILRRFPDSPEWQEWIAQVPKGAQEPSSIELTAERALELAVEVASPNGPVTWGEKYGVPPSRRDRFQRYWAKAKSRTSRGKD